MSCPKDTIEYNLADSRELQIKMADTILVFYEVAGKRNVVFMNFAVEITPYCDCFPVPDISIVPDVDIFASYDQVAIDKAAVDTLNRMA